MSPVMITSPRSRRQEDPASKRSGASDSSARQLGCETLGEPVEDLLSGPVHRRRAQRGHLAQDLQAHALHDVASAVTGLDLWSKRALDARMPVTVTTADRGRDVALRVDRLDLNLHRHAQLERTVAQRR